MNEYSILALRRLNSAINRFTITNMSIITPPKVKKYRIKPLYVKQSFTLIELLIVVAIIGLLAAMTLPVLNKAREQARNSVDLSNLKQIATSAITYTVDNKDLYPYRKIWNEGGSNEFIKKGSDDERNMMLAYLGDLNGILTCPHSPSELNIQESSAKNIRIDYSRYWGTDYPDETGSMRMAGQALVYDKKEFRILASDYMEEKVLGATWGSHEDNRNTLKLQETSSTSMLSSRWGNTSGALIRGQLNLNYVFDDGHAITISSIIAGDDRFTNLPKTNAKSSNGLQKWLPIEE